MTLGKTVKVWVTDAIVRLQVYDFNKTAYKAFMEELEELLED